MTPVPGGLSLPGCRLAAKPIAARPCSPKRRSRPGCSAHTAPPPASGGLIHMLESRLLYRVLDPPSECVLDPTTAPGVVEPSVPHEVAPLGPVRFQVEFHRMANAPEANPESGQE